MADYATLLRDHVTLTCRSVDRIFLQAYVPKLHVLPPFFRRLPNQVWSCIPRKEVMGTRKYPVELRERAVRLYRESDPKAVIRRLAEQLNVHPEALRNWIRQAEADAGERDDRPTTAMIEENRRLAKENAELRRVNEVLRAASAYFAAEIDPTRRRS
jgi:transposase